MKAMNETVKVGSYDGSYDKYDRAKLLLEAASKPVFVVGQIDSDPAVPDGINWGWREELRTTGKDLVRLQFPKGMEKEEVIKAVTRTLEALKCDVTLFDDKPHAVSKGALTDFEYLRKTATMALRLAHSLSLEEPGKPVWEKMP